MSERFVPYTRVYETSARVWDRFIPAYAWDSFWWHHKGPETSQSTDLIKWPIYFDHLIDIMGIEKHTTKYSWHQYVAHGHLPVQLWLKYFDICRIGVLVDSIHYLESQKKTSFASRCTTTKRLSSRCFYFEICFLINERGKVSTTPWLWLIDTCDSWGIKRVSPRLQSFYHLFVAGINLPQSRCSGFL